MPKRDPISNGDEEPGPTIEIQAAPVGEKGPWGRPRRPVN